MHFEVHIQLLNGFSITEGSDEKSDFHPPRIQSLLTYLILNRHTPQPRQQVAFLLWPESTEKQAFTNLRKLLYVIRQAQNGTRIIDIQNRSLQYAHDDAHQVDLISFENHLLSASHSAEVKEKRQHLEAAIDLYRGELTPHLKDEWLIKMRQDLHNRYMSAALELIQLLETCRDLPRALFYGERLLQADRFRESTYQLLMRLHLSQDDHAAALMVFDNCRRLLADELGVYPSGTTEKLYLEALAVEKKPVELAEISFVKPKPVKHNLPFQPTSFIGREDELNTLEDYLLDSNCRLISILGAGGMGKTRLALALAQKLLDQHRTQFPDGIFFVPLTDIRDSSHIPMAIATACNISLGSGGQPFRDPGLQVLDYLRGKRLLLIFDNFEHLIEEPQFVLDILSTAPDNKLIVTSREKLRLRSEQRFVLEGLEFPDKDISKEVTEYPAAKLFLLNAKRVNHRFKLAEIDEMYLHQICQLVEGMPLAVELAAGWADMFSIREIAEKIQEGLDFLESDALDMPDHHRSMRVVIDTSWNRLDKIEKSLFPQLSIFRGGFSLEAAVEIAGADVETLNGLCSKSLLQFDRVLKRYQIHELVRQYGSEKFMDASESSPPIFEKHSRYYLCGLNEQEKRLKGAEQRDALTWIARDLENIQVAWQRAVDQCLVEPLYLAIGSLAIFYDWTGRYRAGLQIFATSAAKLNRCNQKPAQLEAFQINLKIKQATFQRLVGNIDSANSLLVNTLSDLDEIALSQVDTDLFRAQILFQQGNSILTRDKDKASTFYTHSIQLFKSLNKDHEVSEALIQLSEAARSKERYAESIEYLQESLNIKLSLNDQRGMAIAYLQLSHSFAYTNRREECESVARKGFAILEKLGDRALIAYGLDSLSIALEWARKHIESTSIALQALEIYRELGNRSALAKAHFRVGIKYGFLAKFEESRAHLLAGLEIIHDQDQNSDAAWALFILGWVSIGEGELVESRQHLLRSMAIYEKTGQKNQQIWPIPYLSYVEWHLDNKEMSRNYLHQALEISNTAKNLFGTALSILIYALLLASEAENEPNEISNKKMEKAIELIAYAQEVYFINNEFFKFLPQKAVISIESKLPSNTFEAAKRRGRTLDQWEEAEKILAVMRAEGWNIDNS